MKWMRWLDEKLEEMIVTPFLLPYCLVMWVGAKLIEAGWKGMIFLFPVAGTLLILTTPFVVVGLILTPFWWVWLAFCYEREWI
jgi:hypothetical protein